MSIFKTNAKTTVGIFLTAACVFIWGITFVNTKYLLNDFSAFEILVIRFLFAYIGLCIFCPHKIHIVNKYHELLFAAAGFSGVALYQFLENIAINYTSASNVSIIVSICPFFTALTAQLFLKEKNLSIKFFFGFITAMIGVILVSFNGTLLFRFNPKGDILALIAAISWGFYSLFISKINKSGYHGIAATRHIFFYALIFMGLFLIFNEVFPTLHHNQTVNINLSYSINKTRFSSISNWLNLLFLGIGASAFCFVAWNTACNLIGTVRTTVGIYLIPVVTISFAFLFLHESISLMGIIGAILTISGLVISEWKRH